VSRTVDCGEGKHDLCLGTGRVSYLFPQENRDFDEPPFFCGCRCHHEGTVSGFRGVPCADPECIVRSSRSA